MAYISYVLFWENQTQPVRLTSVRRSHWRSESLGTVDSCEALAVSNNQGSVRHSWKPREMGLMECLFLFFFSPLRFILVLMLHILHTFFRCVSVFHFVLHFLVFVRLCQCWVQGMAAVRFKIFLDKRVPNTRSLNEKRCWFGGFYETAMYLPKC